MDIQEAIAYWAERDRRRTRRAERAGSQVQATISCEDQVNAKLQEMAEAVRQMAPKPQHNVRTRWAGPDGLTWYEERQLPGGSIIYRVYDVHGHYADAGSVSEAEQAFWVMVCLEGWCDACEDKRAEVVCAPDVVGTLYWGLCLACYLARPADLEPEVWANVAQCPVRADCLGRCYRDRWHRERHLHLVDSASGPIVVGVRPAGPEWFELVGRPVPLAEYQASISEA